MAGPASFISGRQRTIRCKNQVVCVITDLAPLSRPGHAILLEKFGMRGVSQLSRAHTNIRSTLEATFGYAQCMHRTQATS
jgi:hypothetical protein